MIESPSQLMPDRLQRNVSPTRRQIRQTSAYAFIYIKVYKYSISLSNFHRTVSV